MLKQVQYDGLFNMKKGGYVYRIGYSSPTLCIGATSDLVRGIYEHRNGIVKGFTSKYNAHRLLYFETDQRIEELAPRLKT